MRRYRRKPPHGLGLAQPTPAPLGLAEPELEKLFQENRAIGRQREMFEVLTPPNPGDGRQLEFYPPWESNNPAPGKATVEIYNNSLSPEATRGMIAADMLHYFGAMDPRSGKPVDPTVWKLKQKFAHSLTPEQHAIDQRAYERARAGEFGQPEQRPYDEWFDVHRLDQYLGSMLLPEGSANRNDWMSGMTPEQKQYLDQLQQYLRRGSIAPGMNR